MHTTRCCSAASDNRPETVPPLRLAGVLLPGFVIVLMPKCPVCLAAYFTLLSGYGLSVASAGWVRSTLMVLCATTMAMTVFSSVVRAIRRRRHVVGRDEHGFTTLPLKELK